MRGIRMIWLGVLFALALSGTPRGVSGQPVPPTPTRDAAQAETTALVVSATNPMRVLASDGLEHVVYDLIITNAFSAPVTLTVIEVLASDGTPLLRLAGDGLKSVTQPVGGMDPTDQVPVAGVVATSIELALPPGVVPDRLSNRIAYELPTSAPALIDTREVVTPGLDVGPRSPLVISPPLRGDGWFNANGCCGLSFHRAARIAVDGTHYVKPETFAVDWLRIQDGGLFTGDGSRPEQWHGFGADILAVADGTVVSVNDGMAEGTPFQLPAGLGRSVDYAGNQIVLQIGPGVWAIYAHLQPGSITVQEGERVPAGRPIARLGNTGNSFAPHLHFQLSDGPTLLSSNSVPFVLDRYTIVGEVEPQALAAAFSDPSGFSRLPVTDVITPQAGTLPLLGTVVEFP
jgi:Peptidase family M23